MSFFTMDSRRTKKVKYNSPVVNIGHNDIMSVGINTTVLNIQNNNSIRDISDIPHLSIASLMNTKVVNIQMCPSLYTLSIIENDGIEMLSLPNVCNLTLKNALTVRMVNMPAVEKANLDDLPMLSHLSLPNATVVKISNMTLWEGRFEDNCMPIVKSLQLKNIRGHIDEQHFMGIDLNTLIIDNCDIIKLTNLHGYHEVIIRNCKFLRTIEGFTHIHNLSVRNCPSLFVIDNLKNIGMISVDSCDALRDVRRIDALTILIEYCSSIMEIVSTVVVEKIIVKQCHSLDQIGIHSDLSQLVVDSCKTLRNLEFVCDTPYCYSELKIGLYGNNMIQDIDGWFASELVIKGNFTLETITNVYNNTKLIISDCAELTLIAGVFILQELIIQCCPCLESIINAYGFNSLSIIDCESLIDFSITSARLTSLVVSDCPELNLILDGEFLTALSMVNTGLPIIKNLSKHSIIQTRNVSLLPDLLSSPLDVLTPLADEDVVYPEAVMLADHMAKLIRSGKIISDRSIAYRLRVKYLKYIEMKNLDRICGCVICHERIFPNEVIFTECDHMFHASCLNTWLGVRRTCPLCNAEI